MIFIDVRSHAIATSPVIVAIDAGGTTTRSRAVQAGAVVHEGTGGPGNPLTSDAGVLRTSYAAALAGCPTPDRIVACVAGARALTVQDRVRAALAELHPGATVVVVPDFVAAFHSFPVDINACVIAGTGSLVCSRSEDGSWQVSGGKGWILGDRGSATRLGQALLSWYANQDDDVPSAVSDGIHKALEATTREDAVTLLYQIDRPATVLARMGPVVTWAAETGHEFAEIILADEMESLAATTNRHVSVHRPGAGGAVGLVGGVWTSSAAVAVFRDALRRLSPKATVTVAAPDAPIAGALAFAVSLP